MENFCHKKQKNFVSLPNKISEQFAYVLFLRRNPLLKLMLIKVSDSFVQDKHASLIIISVNRGYSF